MDLARDQYSFGLDGSRSHAGAAPAGAALSAQIVRDLLSAPDTPREALVAALEETTRQFDSLLSCVSGIFYRCELTPPWRMEFISPGVETISGYHPQVFAEIPFGDIVVAEDQALLAATVAEAVERRDHFTACYRIRHKSGTIRWVSERGAAVCDAAGRPQFLEGFIVDVTEAKELELVAERARRVAEKVSVQMARILEYSLEGIVSFDAEWNYRFLNKTALNEVPGSPRGLGTNLFAVQPDIRETAAWPVLQQAMEQREPARVECRMGSLGKWYEIYVVPDGEGVTAFFRDISDSRRLERALVSQADDLRSTLDSIPDMVWTAHPDGRGDFYNRSWNAFLGRTPGQNTEYGLTPTGDWIHPDDVERCMDEWKRSLEAGAPFEVEFRMRHHSGEYRWLMARCWPQRDAAGDIVKWCGAATDIHERFMIERSLRESRNLQINLLDASSDCIEITDLDGRLLFHNAAARTMRGGIDDTEVIGRPWASNWPEASRARAEKALRKALRGNVSRLVESSRDGAANVGWWDIIVSPIRGMDGDICNVLSIARDITEQKAISEKLRVASEEDVLTGLPNRRAFDKHLKKVTSRARETGGNVGLMLLDLDHFKHVNDTLGHLAGDHLLKVIARRLQACVRDSGFVARLGGDEFAIVLGDIHEEKELVSAATQILARMEVAVTFGGKPINGGLSIGCAMYPRDADDAQSLLQHTDTALYDLKDSGRGGIQMFNTRMMEAAERTANQLALARTAIRDDAVEPYYQPKVRLDTGEISGFEALLRWWSPGNGIQPPSSVAEAFNDYELSTKIGGLMQSRVFADMSAWLHQGLALPPVSINAAPAEFLRDDYAERLLDRLREHAISPALIEVEITEHVFLERRTEQVIRALELLKQAGVRIALDDFGTGHSSLAHLRDFPVDVLKIDRSFVSGMLTRPRMLAIVQAITKLGPSLSLDIVAEGVETPEQLHALREAGCEFGQGYLFGKAMHAAEVGRRLATENWPFKLRAVG